MASKARQSVFGELFARSLNFVVLPLAMPIITPLEIHGHLLSSSILVNTPADQRRLGEAGASMRAVMAGLACLLSGVSTFAMWEAVASGHVATIGPLAGLGAAGLSGVLCITLIRQPYIRVLLLLVALCGGLLAAYTLVQPFHQWVDALLGWRR